MKRTSFTLITLTPKTQERKMCSMQALTVSTVSWSPGVNQPVLSYFSMLLLLNYCMPFNKALHSRRMWRWMKQDPIMWSGCTVDTSTTTVALTSTSRLPPSRLARPVTLVISGYIMTNGSSPLRQWRQGGHTNRPSKGNWMK